MAEDVGANLDVLDQRLLHLLGQDAKALASIAQELGLPISDSNNDSTR